MRKKGNIDVSRNREGARIRVEAFDLPVPEVLGIAPVTEAEGARGCVGLDLPADLDRAGAPDEVRPLPLQRGGPVVVGADGLPRAVALLLLHGQVRAFRVEVVARVGSDKSGAGDRTLRVGRRRLADDVAEMLADRGVIGNNAGVQVLLIQKCLASSDLLQTLRRFLLTNEFAVLIGGAGPVFVDFWAFGFRYLRFLREISMYALSL